MARIRGFAITLACALLVLAGAFGHSAAPRAALATPGVVEIDHPESFDRVLAISDVHGMYQPLLQLLTANHVIGSDLHWTAGKTLLVVIGDSIDKGPQSVEVVDLWIALASQAPASGGQVLHLLGNHEAEFLSNPDDDDKAKDLITELQSKGISADEFADPSSPRGAFLHGLPLAARVGRWLFAHSGQYPDLSWAEFTSKASQDLASSSYGDSLVTGSDSILEAKKWEIDPNTRAKVEASLDSNSLSGLIFGHQPAALNVEGWSAISNDGRLIKIDNGMAPQAGAHAGTLLEIAPASQLNGRAPLSVHVLTPQGEAKPLEPESDRKPPGSGKNDD